jgi:hypothetical protein
MRLPRMTTRRWMIAVVAVGSLTWATLLQRRRAHYLSRAAQHANVERAWRAALARLTVPRRVVRNTQDGPETRVLPPLIADSVFAGMERRARQSAEYHARLRVKYQRAGARPWGAVPPDPPPPWP